MVKKTFIYTSISKNVWKTKKFKMLQVFAFFSKHFISFSQFLHFCRNSKCPILLFFFSQCLTQIIAYLSILTFLFFRPVHVLLLHHLKANIMKCISSMYSTLYTILFIHKISPLEGYSFKWNQYCDLSIDINLTIH